MCIFEPLLKASVLLNQPTKDQNIDENLESLKNIAEREIYNLPSEINRYRNMDAHYSVNEAIEIMKKAGSITACDLNASELLLSNPPLATEPQVELQNAILDLTSL